MFHPVLGGGSECQQECHELEDFPWFGGGGEGWQHFYSALSSKFALPEICGQMQLSFVSSYLLIAKCYEKSTTTVSIS